MDLQSRNHPSGVLLRIGLSWLVMLAVSTLAWVSIIGLRGQHAADEPLLELAFQFPLVMAFPFAFVLAVVYIPVLFAARSIGGGGRLWLGLAGAATGPVAGFVLIMAGHVVFSNWSRARPTIWAEFARISRDPLYSTPWLLALVVGGIVLGLGISGRARRATS